MRETERVDGGTSGAIVGAATPGTAAPQAPAGRTAGRITLAVLGLAGFSVLIQVNSEQVPPNAPQSSGLVGRAPDTGASHLHDTLQGHHKMLNKITSVTAAAVVGIAATVAGAQSGAVQWRVEDGGNGHWYRVVLERRIFAESANHAIAVGGYLTEIDSSAENSFCFGLASADLAAWYLPSIGFGQGPYIGSHRVATEEWVHLSGASMLYSGWCSGQPDNNGGGQSVATYWAPTGQPSSCWDDVGPEFVNSSIIEWSADCNADGIVDYGQCHDGSLADINSNNIPDSCEVPSGWIVIADSVADYATTQGVKGWHYLFDTGLGTPVVPMAYVVTSGFPPFMPAWCTHPEFGGGGSYCSIDRIQCHTSTPSNCSSSSAGLERPHRRWINSSGVKGTVLISGYFGATAGSTTRLQLFADGALVFEQVNSAGSTAGNLTPISAVVDIPPTSVLDVVIDPNDGSCHADRVAYSIRIIGADCNNDSIVDYGQILTGQLADSNTNGIPDICEQPQCQDADITNNQIIDGADLGAMLAFWGPVNPVLPQADINHDGEVNGADLSLLLSFWGPCP